MGCQNSKNAAAAVVSVDLNAGPKQVGAAKEAPILARVRQHATAGLVCALAESSPEASIPRKLSYADLLIIVEDVASTVAGLLAKRRDGLPNHVAYLVKPGFAYAVIELAIWKAGAVCVPLSVHSPTPELEYYVEDSDAALVIADEASMQKLRPVAENLKRLSATVRTSASADDKTISIKLEAEHDDAAADINVDVPIDSPALILYTSGTTGKPKGVVHTFKSLTAQMESLSAAWKWSSEDYTLHVLPLHHIHGVQNILNTALFNGAGVEFTPFNAAFCLKRLTSGDITCFHAVPTIYTKFTQHLSGISDAECSEIKKGLRNPSLRYMVSGSAALPVPTMQAWAEISGHVLLERYGMTEIGMALSNSIDGTRYPACVGWPLPGVEVMLDQDGGILVKGDVVFKEYYRRPEATAKEFTADGWFKTGDTGAIGGSSTELQKLQEDAREVEQATGQPREDTEDKAPKALMSIYKIMGRSSVDIIKSGGYKISGLEIEGVLLQHEKIKEVAVIGKPDLTWGEKVTAVAVLAPNQSLSLEELRMWGKERLATYKVPQELQLVTELPRNQMGKLEKKKLLERYKVPEILEPASEEVPVDEAKKLTQKGPAVEEVAGGRWPFHCCLKPVVEV